MKKIPGIAHPEIQALPQISKRMSFLYLEHCMLNRQNGAITATDDEGCIHIPAHSISVLMLGPGTNITHRAMELIGDAGISILWVGEYGVRYYAGGRPLTHSSALLLKQAELVSNKRKHLDVARKMYSLRFPNEDVSGLTMQQLRGKEGTRVKKIYKTSAEKWGILWDKRVYDVEDFSKSDPVNQALTAGHVCLYGLAHAVISALGCSTGLGFVHVGHENSFVYDIADLYKAEVTIPLAFEVAASCKPEDDISSLMRKRTRDAIKKNKLLERMVKDIKFLLDEENSSATAQDDIIYLWDDKYSVVKSGKSYAVGDDLYGNCNVN